MPAATAGRASGKAIADAPAQRRAQQTRGLHQMRGALGQRGARQQVNIGIERKNKHPGRAAQTAHFRQHAALHTRGSSRIAVCTGPLNCKKSV